jgi:hypothetical protein
MRWGCSWGRQQEGSPGHMARMQVVERVGQFKRALKRGYKCGHLTQTCRTKSSTSFDEGLLACAWRDDRGKVVAASVGQPTRWGNPDYTRSALWADWKLLRGRCP